MGRFIQGLPVCICFVRQGIRIRLVAHAPHNDAGMVLIPGNHIRQYLQMISGQIPSVLFAGPHTHRRRLIHNDNPFPVAELIHFLRIRIMAGPEAVCIQPVVEIDIRHIQAGIHSPAVNRTVLMLAGSVEPERLPVDQKAGSLHPDLPDAKGLLIQIFAIGNPGGIQIGRPGPGLPQMRLRNMQDSLPGFTPRHRKAFRIQDLHQDQPVRPFCLDAEAHFPVHGRNQGDVPDKLPGGRNEPHRPLNPGVIEKIKGRPVDTALLLHPFPGFHRRNTRIVGAKESRIPLGTDRQRIMIDPVIRLNR